MTGALTPLVVAGVLVAGAVGAVLRYALSRALPVRPGHLPGGILIVNVVGSALAGALIDDARAQGHRGRLWAYPRVENVGSNAICQKTGFRLDAQEEFEYPPGNWQTSNNWVYELAEPPRA